MKKNDTHGAPSYRALLTSSIGALAIATSLGAPGDAYAQTAGASSDVDEIVVTARKREERLQDVPIAVTALSSAALEQAGAIDTQDLDKLAPGLFYSSFAPSVPNLYIRGVGTRNYDAGSESSIGTFVDGVYMARFGSQIQDLAGIERVEVLRGPQGALFGRNTIGGAINIITRKPSDEFQADVSAAYGRSEHFESDQSAISAVVSGPLVSDRLYGLISYARREDDGATRIEGAGGLGNGGGQETARARVVLRPTEGDLQFDLSADVYDSFDGNWIWTTNDFGGARPEIFLANGLVVSPINPDPYVTNVTPGYGAVARNGWGVTGTITDTIGGIDVTSITAYRENQNGFDNDLDGTAADAVANPATEGSSQFTQELRFASGESAPLSFGGRVEWLIGAYYFKEDIDRLDTVAFGPDSVLFSVYHQYSAAQVSTESWAVFGQVGIDITDQLRLDIGLRTSHDEKEGILSADEDIPGLSLTPFVLAVGDSWDSTDPSISLSYNINPDVMVFASYASGFKSGAFQFGANTPTDAERIADPESVDAYQLGLRADWFDRRLRTNVSAFHYDYSDMQVPRVEVSGLSTVVRTTNAGAATVDGVEIEGYGQLNDQFRVEFGYAYLDAVYEDYVYSTTPVLIDFTDNRLPRSPRHTLDAALVFETTTPFGDLTARVSGNYVDSLYFEPDNAEISPGVEEPSHTTFDASIGLTQGPLSVTLWGRNLTDEEYRATVLNLSPTSRLLEIWAPRRVVGVTLAGHW